MYRQQVAKHQLMSAVFLVVLSLYGCTYPQPQELPFETIDERIGGLNYFQKEPDIFLIAGPDDIDALASELQFPAYLSEQLHKLDYQRNFVIGVLRGEAGDEKIEILQIVRRGKDVFVKVHFTVPEPGSIVHGGLVSYPYKIISVSREGEWAQEIRLVLEVDGQLVKERVYSIP